MEVKWQHACRDGAVGYSQERKKAKNRESRRGKGQARNEMITSRPKLEEKSAAKELLRLDFIKKESGKGGGLKEKG